MNFTEYCIATKNYSTLNAINDYTKSFASFERFDFNDIPEREKKALNKKLDFALEGKLRKRKLGSTPETQLWNPGYVLRGIDHKLFKDYHIQGMADSYNNDNKRDYLDHKYALQDFYRKGNPTDYITDSIAEMAKEKLKNK